jgi:diacylglycerol kinase (ATP)
MASARFCFAASRNIWLQAPIVREFHRKDVDLNRMKTLFLVNPKAGRGSALRVWQRIEPLVPRERGVEVVIPDSLAATRKTASEAVKAGVERVVVVGGDGTLLSVADELVHSDTAVGLIPAGTGNDFRRDYGLPRRPEEALAVALGRETQRVDVGQAWGGRHFLNAAGIGFDAEVAVKASTYPSGLGGTLPYLMGAITTLLQYRPMEVRVTVDGERRYEGDSTMIAVANGRYYGGGMQIAPSARRDDGLIDVCIAEGMGPLKLLGLLPQVYGGGHVRSPRVHVLRGEHVQIEVGAPVRAHVDGDPLPYESLTFQARARALRVAMPGEGEARGLPRAGEARR